MPHAHTVGPIGLCLKKARTERSLSQEQLASMAGISRTTIAALECGQRGNSTSATLQKIADSLGITIGELLDESRP
jgi:transcriptional regulator with XRE-family HTH domain